MTQIKAILADDEEQLRIYLKKKLSKLWPDLDVCGEAKDGPEALDLFREHNPDIAFLDIKMPGLSGMEVAREIVGKCRIVFITAFDQYAIKAFETEAVDYIVKPVTDERLIKTITRLQRDIDVSQKPSADSVMLIKKLIKETQPEKRPEYINWIKVQHGDGIRLIPVAEILYFKASEKYTVVMTEQGESLIRKSIKELAKELNPNQFWRIHRGTIINVCCIDKTSRSISGNYLVKLKDRPEKLPVSRSYLHLFKQM